MFKAQDIIGKSIVSYGSGKILNTVYDVISDPENNRVLGFLVDESLMLAKGRHVPFNEVRAIGEDALTVDTEDAIQTARDNPDVKRMLDKKMTLKNHKVLTENGEDLGKIIDFYFDEHTGAIEGYDISSGVATNLYSGTAFLPSPEITKIGEDVVFVPNETVEILESQVGGMQGVFSQAVHKAREKVGPTVGYGKEFMETQVMEPATKYKEHLGQELPNKAHAVVDQADSLWEKVKDKAHEWKTRSVEELEERQIKEALGRPVTRVILTPDDTMLLNTGELVTNQAINQARDAGVLDLLLSSVAKEKPHFDTDELKAEES